MMMLIKCLICEVRKTKYRSTRRMANILIHFKNRSFVNFKLIVMHVKMSRVTFLKKRKCIISEATEIQKYNVKKCLIKNDLPLFSFVTSVMLHGLHKP